MNIAKQHLINRTSIRTHNATINKSMLNALNEPDLYRFFCLSLYRNSYYNVRLRIEDIAKITGEKEEDTSHKPFQWKDCLKATDTRW